MGSAPTRWSTLALGSPTRDAAALAAVLEVGAGRWSCLGIVSTAVTGADALAVASAEARGAITTIAVAVGWGQGLVTLVLHGGPRSALGRALVDGALYLEGDAPFLTYNVMYNGG